MKMGSYLLLMVNIAMLLPLVASDSTGALLTACGAMSPSQSALPQATEQPYMISLNGIANQGWIAGVTCYKEGTPVHVEVKSNLTEAEGGKHFEGLFIQARRYDWDNNRTTDEIIGTFVTEGLSASNLKTISCSNNDDQNTLTNSSKGNYYSKSFEWMPPAGFGDMVIFQATVVHEKLEFWMGIKSHTLTYLSTCKYPITTTTPGSGATSISTNALYTLGITIALLLGLLSRN